MSTGPADPVMRALKRDSPALIIGGAGFIGTNVAHRILSSGKPVLILDNLSRPGVEQNLRWLRDTHGELLQMQFADVRDFAAVTRAVHKAAVVFHFAAQVAVTTSLSDPIGDFEVNARGTLNVLEALRERGGRVPLLFTSTNKVYGDLADVTLREGATRHEPRSRNERRFGISEDRALAFHSPYGCSKGAAEQYVLDYARTFGLPAVVFRMSCIYGPHQFGNEDQGWVAHFAIRTLTGGALTVYGDGKQVRDILCVEDLVTAMLSAIRWIDRTRGHAFNIGGGPSHTTSLVELVDLLGEIHGERVDIEFAPWRQADQRHYVSDTRKFEQATGWTREFDVRAGVTLLYRWLAQNHPDATVSRKRRSSPAISTETTDDVAVAALSSR